LRDVACQTFGDCRSRLAATSGDPDRKKIGGGRHLDDDKT